MVLLSLLMLLGSFLQVPAATAAQALGVPADAPLTTDLPAPGGLDGVQASAGGWYGPYTFRALHSNKCLDMPDAATHNGAAAAQHECVAGAVAQKWYLWQTEGDGTTARFIFRSAASGKCLEPAYSGVGAPVVQYPCYVLTNQIWQTDGEVYSNVWSYLCLDVLAASQANRASVIASNCHGGANQTWLRYDA
ncbi:RICIN domain-containing protein [Saccharothrix lopnurensis]|uniref:RICIN domain-containing protein n=1 Tax=Saccharothrix lopnurensis TaxID=1670621 RepID=A0ABW1NZC2_9PSEU